MQIPLGHYSFAERETPIAEDMSLENADDGKVFTAPVVETWQLHWWVLSHAGALVVISPKRFRQAIAERLSRGQDMCAD